MRYFCLKLVWGIGFLITTNGSISQEVGTNVEAINFDNLYRINVDLYRCEQPSKKGMRELETLGIKTVFNLRNRMNDKREAKGTILKLEHLRINTWKMNYNHVVEALKIIDRAEKPVALHCLHGSDRTGVIIAAYRMAVENWTKEAALKEFLDERFGYHEKWFPKILKLLKGVDIAMLKKDITRK